MSQQQAATTKGVRTNCTLDCVSKQAEPEDTIPKVTPKQRIRSVQRGLRPPTSPLCARLLLPPHLCLLKGILLDAERRPEEGTGGRLGLWDVGGKFVC